MLCFIVDHAFQNVETLRSLTIPDQVDTIGVCAFSECRDLRSIHLSAALTKIDDLVLDECNSLLEIDIPEKVTTIMRDVFTNIYPAVFTFGKNLTESSSIPSAQKFVFRGTVVTSPPALPRFTLATAICRCFVTMAFGPNTCVNISLAPISII